MNGRSILKLVGLGIVGLVVVLVGGFLVGVLGVPTVEVADAGDWGETTDNETEVITELRVSNPNPIGITIGGGFTATYGIELNGVRVVDGARDSISIPKGNSTLEVVSTIDNDRLVPWWRAYVRNDETIEMQATGEVTIGTLMGTTIELPTLERTLLEDDRPVIDAFDGAVSSLEGEYSQSAAVGTIGYSIESASADWAGVTERTSTIRLDIRVRNSGDVVMPLSPEGFRLDAEANGIALFEASQENLTIENAASDATLAPGEARTITYTVRMTNDHIDDWFVSHVERDERTDLTLTSRLVFEEPRTGVTLSVPPGGVTYNCEFQTAILVDDQETTTTCGQPTS